MKDFVDMKIALCFVWVYELHRKNKLNYNQIAVKFKISGSYVRHIILSMNGTPHKYAYVNVLWVDSKMTRIQ